MISRNLSLDNPELKVCSRCIYDERVAAITFDDHGVCNYCLQIDRLKQEYGTGTEAGKGKMASIVDEIKLAGIDKKYDCVIGVSENAADLIRVV